MDEVWHVQTVGYYSAIKKNEIMSFEGKLMEQDYNMFSKIRYSQKAKYCIVSLICRI
jgi:enolase